MPVYSSESINNGIIGFTNKGAEFIVNKNNPVYVIFGDHTRSFNIATESFCVMDNVKVLRLRKALSIKVLLFVISSWKKCIPNNGYSRHWSFAKKSLFHLPITKDNKIDISHIERIISEIESKQIEKINNYLSNNELSNYELTDTDKKVLIDFENQKFIEFNIVDIFNIKNTASILSREIMPNSGVTPYLCASSENNGVSTYITYNDKYLEKGNCIFISGKTFIVSYQEMDFFSNDSHNLVLYLKHNEYSNKNSYLYLATCINKSIGHKYSWGDSISNGKIKKDKVFLPVLDNKPNYEIMTIFISVIKKMALKDVDLYAQRKKLESKL